MLDFEDLPEDKHPVRLPLMLVPTDQEGTTNKAKKATALNVFDASKGGGARRRRGEAKRGAKRLASIA